MAAVMSRENALYHFMLRNIESGWDVGDFMLRDSIVTPMFKLGLYSPRNDPQPWNDPQIDPEMIPISLDVDREMIPNLIWNGTCIPSRNYYKFVASFTFLNRV